MGALVEKALTLAVRSLRNRDPKAAEEVLEGDHRIDLREVEIEEECLKILALHQPVAEDLRFITTVLKINNDLERMGDLGVNIAERALSLTRLSPIPLPEQLGPMTEATLHMVRESLNAFVHRDPAMARKVCRDDDAVDEYNVQIIGQIRASLREEKDLVEPNLHFFSAARYLERIADHATNIAEDVVYMVEGEIIRHGFEGGFGPPEVDA
jgi:phosphate transport system protein